MSKKLYPFSESLGRPAIICTSEYPKYSMVPLCIVHDPALIHADIRVYAHLRARCIDKPITWVSQKSIGKCIGISKSSVHNSIRRLEVRGLIHVTRDNQQNGKANIIALIHPRTVYGEAAYYDWDAIWAAVTKRQIVAEGVQLTEPPVVRTAPPDSAGAPPQREQSKREEKERDEFERSRASSDSASSMGTNKRNQQQAKERILETVESHEAKSLHRMFEHQTEVIFGFSFVPKFRGSHARMWRAVILRCQGLENAMSVVRFTCENWSELQSHLGLADLPTVNLFASSWLDTLTAKKRAVQRGWKITDRFRSAEEEVKAKKLEDYLRDMTPGGQ